MRFIGQDFIMNQLKFLLPDLYTHQERGANFLFSGPSGFGKTTMALGVCNYLADTNFEFYLADSKKFRLHKRVIFIDEVFRLKEFEVLYPIMDEKSHVFVFATNHDANLPEAFVNRCWQYIFTDYSTDELLLICRSNLSVSIPDSGLLLIIESGNRNPRIIKSLLDRITTYLQTNSINPYVADYDEILTRVFDIKDGMDTLCRRYLEILDELGGTSSISMIKSALHVDENTIRNTVEPVLLRKKQIKITSKGRSLL